MRALLIGLNIFLYCSLASAGILEFCRNYLSKEKASLAIENPKFPISKVLPEADMKNAIEHTNINPIESLALFGPASLTYYERLEKSLSVRNLQSVEKNLWYSVPGRLHVYWMHGQLSRLLAIQLKVLGRDDLLSYVQSSSLDRAPETKDIAPPIPAKDVFFVRKTADLPEALVGIVAELFLHAGKGFNKNGQHMDAQMASLFSYFESLFVSTEHLITGMGAAPRFFQRLSILQTSAIRLSTFWKHVYWFRQGIERQAMIAQVPELLSFLSRKNMDFARASVLQELSRQFLLIQPFVTRENPGQSLAGQRAYIQYLQRVRSEHESFETDSIRKDEVYNQVFEPLIKSARGTFLDTLESIEDIPGETKDFYKLGLN